MKLFNVEVQVRVQAMDEDEAYESVDRLMRDAVSGAVWAPGVRGHEILEEAVTEVEDGNS